MSAVGQYVVLWSISCTISEEFCFSHSKDMMWVPKVTEIDEYGPLTVIKNGTVEYRAYANYC